MSNDNTDTCPICGTALQTPWLGERVCSRGTVNCPGKVRHVESLITAAREASQAPSTHSAMYLRDLLSACADTLYNEVAS